MTVVIPTEIPTLASFKRPARRGTWESGRVLDRDKLIDAFRQAITDGLTLHTTDYSHPVTMGRIARNAVQDDGAWDDGLRWAIIYWRPGDTSEVLFSSVNTLVEHVGRWFCKHSIAIALAKAGLIDDASNELGTYGTVDAPAGTLTTTPR
jgi:hypothetical protein